MYFVLAVRQKFKIQIGNNGLQVGDGKFKP